MVDFHGRSEARRNVSRLILDNGPRNVKAALEAAFTLNKFLRVDLSAGFMSC